jgi:ketosteroid isomerase-like protein
VNGDAQKEAVRSFFAAIPNRDLGTLRGLLRPSAVWWIPVSASSLGVERPLVGRENIVALLGGVPLFRAETMRRRFDHLVAEGNLVACHHTLTALTARGAPYENEYLHLFRFEEGTIAEVWEHLDTAYAYGRFAERPPG